MGMNGTELREVRYSLGLSQRQFAEELGICSNSVARAERNERNISPSVEKLARLLLKVRELEQEIAKKKR